MRAKIFHAVVVIGALYVAGAGCGNGTPDEPTPVCSIAIAPASLGFMSEGGAGNVTVTTAAGCAWTAAVNGSWITLTAGASGNGPGTVAYSVAANSATESRTAVVTIGGQAHAVTQQGRPLAVCAYEVAPDSSTWSNDGGSRTFAVAAADGCSWTALSNAPWVVVDSGQGSGNGTVSYTVARNTQISDRSTTIVVGGRTFTIRQAGDVSTCQYSVTPVDFSPCMPGGTVVALVTTQDSCPWSAAPDASWLNVGSSGVGSGAISIAFPDNYDAPRRAQVLVRWPTATAGQNIRVAQAGCTYAVTRAAFSFGASASSGTFDVLQQSDPIACGGATQDRCVWTAVSDVPWITITTGMPRSGDNPVSFTVAANDAVAGRVGTIRVRDKTVLVTQAGR
jgi:hypothetical protein